MAKLVSFVTIGLFALLFCSVSIAAQQIKVSTIMTAPYTMLKTNHQNLTGNAKYEGFVVDLVAMLFNNLGLQNYELSPVRDGRYGRETSPGEWNGMIGEVKDGHARLAAASLTVTDSRREVVDFTSPFMTFHLKTLIKKSTDSAVRREMEKIKSISDLYNQDVIQYGVIASGSTSQFFSTSPRGSIYRLMFEKMQFFTTTQDGVTKVRQANGRLAFIMEGSSAQYWVMRAPCDLMMIASCDCLDQRQYAIAVKKGDQLKGRLNEALNGIKENGDIQKLEKKWFYDKGECQVPSRASSAVGGTLGFPWITVVLFVPSILTVVR